MAVSGVAAGTMAAGAVLVWTGLRGGSVLTTVQELVQGKKPAGANVRPISVPDLAPSVGGAVATGGLQVAGSATAAAILAAAASKKGQCYQFGAGHGGGDPCASRCTDCSSYVSCVVSAATGHTINMDTGGLSGIGVGVPYAQRAPGDIIVWNGGTGGGHTGIIATVSGGGGQMWNNPCTGCGGVKLSTYPYAGRSAAAAVVRRIT